MKSIIRAILFIILVAPAVRAQQTQAVPKLDRAAVIRAAAAVTRERYPNADDVLVDDLIRVRYEKDGTSITTDETYLKVLTEKGRRDNLSLSFHFTLPYGDVKLDALDIIKPDGAVVPVNIEEQSRVMTDRSQMGSNIYNPNSKVLEVGLPGLQVGDLIRYRSVRRIVKPRVPGTWSDYTVLEYTSPIRRLVYEVDAPSELPLRNIAIRDEVEGTVRHSHRKEGDRILYRWEVTGVPRMYREPNMPPLHTVVQRLLVSTIPDWREISRWYWRLCKSHLEATEAMKQKVSDLTRGLDDRRKKIEAVFKFVSQKVRYMGITTEKEAPGYEPHDVRITFENRYGVCRDKAALLVAMLRVAGIDAYPVLIHNGPKKDPDVPQPFFNHAVVAALNPDGAYTLMDPTDENTRELFPAYLGNQSYLVARPKGEALLTSPVSPVAENLLLIDTRGRVNANGDLFAECTLRFEGINDNAYRGYFARVRPEVRRRYFEGLARRVLPGARLVDFELSPDDMRDTSAPLTATLRIQALDIPIVGDGALMLPPPRFGTRAGMVNFIIGKTGLKKRKYPLVTKFPCGVRETFSLDVRALAGKTIALPQYESVDNPALSAAQSLTFADGMLRGTASFLLKVPEFTPAQYDVLKDTLRTLEFNARKMPLFAGREAGGDMVILNSKVTYDLLDAHTWTETREVRQKILTYAGKKQYSELKFDYNPVWETVTLDEAVVVTAAGDVKTVRPEEMNVMDAAWVGSAPRYPAAKTLVVSLPGVDVGSVITYRVTRSVKGHPFFAAREYFRSVNPVRWKRVVLDRPAGLDCVAETRQPGAVATSTARLSIPRIIRRWTAADQPAVKRESNLPPWWSFNPALCLSTGNWKTYAAEVRAALIRLASDQPATERTATALVAGITDPAARITAIRDFVAERIRLAGPKLHELPLDALTPADGTLADGYGNSADRAALLYAMLRAAGFEPEFVLASQSPVVAGLEHPLRTTPRPAEFPEVLVRVSLGDDTIYLNDTDQYAALGVTAHDGRYGLRLSDGEVITIAAPERMRDRIESAWLIRVRPDGDADILKHTAYFGNAFSAFHRKFAEITPEERNRYHQEAVAKIAQSAEAAGELKTLYRTYPGTETLSVRVKRFAVREGDRLYFSLPGTLENLLNLRAETRRNPLYRPQPRRIAVAAAVIPPEGFDKIILKPQPLSWAAPGEAGTVTIRERFKLTLAAWLKLASENGLTEAMKEAAHNAEFAITEASVDRRKVYLLEQTADLAPMLVSPAGYPRLLDLQRRLSHPAARTFLLQKN